MTKTKIEWCDRTWNPISGCLHGCGYCYARGIARRFKGFEPRCGGEAIPEGEGTLPGSIHNATHDKTLHIFDRKPMRRLTARGYQHGKFVKASYPYGFAPTFHRYRLDEPIKIIQPQTVFVGSKGDLFGEWVPDEWIEEVLKACETAPQHRYLFLTKNPQRYLALAKEQKLPTNQNWFYGTTTETSEKDIFYSGNHNTFISIEPIQAYFDCVRIDDGLLCHVDWVIIGAETGSRKGKVVPMREWVENIVKACEAAHMPVFIKNNLQDIWQEPLIQVFPWEVVQNERKHQRRNGATRPF